MSLHKIDNANPVWRQYLQDNKMKFLTELENPNAIDQLSNVYLATFFFISHSEGHLIRFAEFTYHLDDHLYRIRFDAKVKNFQMQRLVNDAAFPWNLKDLIKPSELTELEFNKVLLDFTKTTLYEIFTD